MSTTRLGLLLFAAALLVRLQYWLGSAVFGTDSCHYLLMADWMRAGRWNDALGIAYHPMYPLLVAAVRALPLATEQAGGVVAVALGAAALLPLFHLVLDFFGRPTAFLAALFYAFHPAIIDVQADVMTEGPYMFFFFGAIWLTWRLMEEPSALRGAAAGLAAGAAFLTRPEGLLPIALALAWPAAEALRRRDRPLRRALSIAVVLLAVLLVTSPYVLWVRSARGHWALSVRPSAISAEKAVGLGETAGGMDTDAKNKAARAYGSSVLRFSLGGLWIPFFAVGLASLDGVSRFRRLFYFSYPLGQWGGIFFTLKTHGFMSERYLLAGGALLGAVAARGGLAALRWAKARRTGRPLPPALPGALVLLLFVGPAVRCLKPRRTELASYRVAAEWLLARHPGPISVSGLEPVSYYCGSRSYYLPETRAGWDQLLRSRQLDYVAYSERELETRPEYVSMLRTHPLLEPAAEVRGPPGTVAVYFQRVRP
jgi:hypothetical protein